MNIFILTYCHAVPFDKVILPIRESLSQFTSEDLSSFEEQNKSRKIKKRHKSNLLLQEKRRKRRSKEKKKRKIKND